MANNAGTFFNINDNDGIPLVGVSTNGRVMINHLYGNCLIGSTSTTGTASQPLQVTGGAYVSGSVGIGTTNPSQSFHLQKNGGAIVLIESTTNYDGNIRLKNSGAQYLIGMLGSPGSTNLNFYDVNASASRMSLDVNGNFGIGMSPVTRLDVQAVSTTSSSFGLRVAGGTNTSDYCASFNNASGTVLTRIDGSGNLLINSTSATGTASQPLQVTGGAYVSGNLGIGIINPTSKLSVFGDGNFTGSVTAPSFLGTATTATNLADASNITTGIISSSRLSGTYGISITGTANTLADASNITTGTISSSRLSGTYDISVTGTATTANNVSSTININTSGIITATTFYGDGSALSGSPSPNIRVISGDTTLSVNDNNKIIVSTASTCVVTLPPIQNGLLFNFITTGYAIGIKTVSTYIHGRKSLTKLSIGSSDPGLTLYSYNNKWHVLYGTAPLHVQSRIFSSGTTYTPTPGTIAFLACVTGGGGGSDGGSNTNKGGGGGGGYAERLYLPPLKSSYSMSIAPNGISSGFIATDGGTTTFGNASVGIITATGGTKGTSVGGGIGGVGQGGDFNANGGNGGAGTNNGGGGGGAAGSRFGNGGNGGDGNSTFCGGNGNLGGNSGIATTGGSDPTSLAPGIYNLGGGLGPVNGGGFSLGSTVLDGINVAASAIPNNRGGRSSAYTENEGTVIPSNLSITILGGGSGVGGNAFAYNVCRGNTAGSVCIIEFFSF